jgi:hypothetical protein
MSKVVPSQIVAFIESVYPSAAKDSNMPVYSQDSAVLRSIIDLAEDLPDELLTISGEDYVKYVFGWNQCRRLLIDGLLSAATNPREHTSRQAPYS